MQAQTQSDEIDLMALLFRLWQQKKRIALIAACSGVLALAATFLLPQKWTTQAQVVAPRNFEITTAMQRALAYANITSEEMPELNQQLYGTFLSELRSRDTRTDFFKQSELFKKLSRDKSDAQKADILRTLVTRQLTVEWPNEKKNIAVPTISFTASDPQDAQKTLSDYLQYLNVQVMHLNDKDFQLMVKNKADTLNHEKQTIEASLSDTQKIKLENLNRALMAARKSGIQEFARTHTRGNAAAPSIALGEAGIELTDDQLSNNGFLFLLGQKYLQAQIDSIKNTDPTFPTEYYTLQQQLPLLEKLLAPQDSALTDQSFHYQSAPFLPLEDNNPSRAFVTLIGLLIGLLAGCAYVLLRNAAIAYRNKEKGEQSA